MKKIVIAALMLALCITLAVPALAEGVRDANAAYNELLAGFNGKYPDEYAGAYVDTSDGDKLCVLLTERHADTAAKLGAARDKMLAHISAAYRDDVKFKTAKYSYNELLAAHDTASELLKDKGYGLSYVGINDMNNAVDVGIIPADHAAAAAFVQADAALSGLPLCVTAAERLSQLGGESPAAMPQAGGAAENPLAAANTHRTTDCAAGRGMGAMPGAAALKRKH